MTTQSERRACGKCSLCCKLLKIDIPELKKPAGRWCEHCRPGRGGCSIYDSRPDGCREFECMWLRGELPEEFYPERSRIVAHSYRNPKHGNPVFEFSIDPSFPDVWRREPYYGKIKQASFIGMISPEKMTVQVSVGDKIFFIYPTREVARRTNLEPGDKERLDRETDLAIDEFEALLQSKGRA